MKLCGVVKPCSAIQVVQDMVSNAEDANVVNVDIVFAFIKHGEELENKMGGCGLPSSLIVVNHREGSGEGEDVKEFFRRRDWLSSMNGEGENTVSKRDHSCVGG